MRKTSLAAVAIVPPENVLEPIQAIRRIHDRQIGRWPPHVNLLYPFLEEEPAGVLESACAGIRPFELELGGFGWFVHGERSATLWLAPEPRGAVVGLQAALAAAFPECDDLARFQDGFAPHLSVGQAAGVDAARQLAAALQAAWKPLAFPVDSVTVLRRGAGTPFIVDRRIPLGTH